jgi:hypothetical protein
MHDITERARLDDEDGTGVRFQISDFRLKEAGINLQSEIYHLQ